jgi:hypothetical protein
MAFGKKLTFEDRAWWHWGAYPTLYPDTFPFHLERGDFDHLREPFRRAEPRARAKPARRARRLDRDRGWKPLS